MNVAQFVALKYSFLYKWQDLYTPLIPELGRQREAADLCELQASQGY